jgi:transposase InsO family protein
LKRSRRPVRYANQLPDPIERMIVAAKKDKPHWGARKIRELLVKQLAGDVRIPARSTVHAVLDRHGLVVHARQRRRCKAEGTHLSQALQPNDLWCADFKGEFKLGNGRYCYPLTVSDQASRFILACEALESTREMPVIEAFVRLFKERGLPAAIRSASSPATQTRTAVTSACTARSRPKPPARPAQTASSNRPGSMPSSGNSTPSDRMKRSP